MFGSACGKSSNSESRNNPCPVVRAVLVQREVDAKDLQAKQAIAVIYSEGPAGPVLLAAVVQPPAP